PFPSPWPSPPYATGVCAFTSPTCRGLFWLPSRKVHANRTRCHSPCFLRRLPITTALWVVVFLRFIDFVLSFGCRTEVQFHFKGETQWQITNHNPSKPSGWPKCRWPFGRTRARKGLSTPSPSAVP